MLQYRYILIFFIFSFSTLFSQETDKKKLPFKFLEQDTLPILTDNEFDSLRQQIWFSDGSPEQYLQVAKYLITLNTIMGRKLAKRYLKRATAIYPDNSIIFSAYGALLEYQGFTSMAVDYFKTATELNVNNGLAWFSLGNYYKNKIEKLKNQVSSASTAITYDDYVFDYYSKAQRAYNKCLKLNYGGDSLRTSLFWIHFEEDKYKDAIKSLIKEYITTAKNWRRNRLLGMAYFYIQDYQKADSCFKESLAQMPYNHHEIYNKSFKLVRRDEDPLNAVTTLDSRDPLWITSYNERLISHYARVTYADEKFSIPKLEVEGWSSDRGIIHIKYGIPIQEFKMRAEKSSNTLIMATIIWIYPDFRIVYSDEMMNGNYQFASLNFPGRGLSRSRFPGDYETFAAGVINQVPDRYRLVTKGGLREAYIEILDKRTTRQPHKFDVLWSYAKSVTEDNKYWRFALYKEDRGWYNEVKQWDSTNFQEYNEKDLMIYQRASIFLPNVAVQFDAILEGYNEKTQEYFREPILKSISTINTDSLLVTDITVAYQQDLASGLTVPTPVHVFNPTELIVVDFQISNLQVYPDDPNLLNLEYELRYIPKDKSLWENITSIFTSDSIGTPVVGFNNEIETFAEEEKVKFIIDVSKLVYGKYELTIEIVEDRSERRAENRTQIEVLSME
jgi:GWxTD domain-containing protein